MVPPYALDLGLFPRYLREAFERSLFGEPRERLAAQQWRRLLEFYLSEATECPAGHLYHPESPACPYCYGEINAAIRLGTTPDALHPNPKRSLS